VAFFVPREKRKEMANCPECDGEIALESDVVRNEILQCPGCGAELEVTAVKPLTLSLAPEEDEDWGE